MTYHIYDFNKTIIESEAEHQRQQQQQQQQQQDQPNENVDQQNCYSMTDNRQPKIESGGDGVSASAAASAAGSNDSLKCSGCTDFICDQFLMRIGNQFWHETCLYCNVCRSLLNRSCFVRDSKVYCKNDYERIFIIRCSQCHQKIQSGDLVMRAQLFTYHLDCFQCAICTGHLRKGDHFVVSNDGQLICERDFSLSAIVEESGDSSNNNNNNNNSDNSDSMEQKLFTGFENVLLLEKDPKLITDVSMGSSSSSSASCLDRMSHGSSNDNENSGVTAAAGDGAEEDGYDDDDDNDDDVDDDGDLDVDDDDGELDPEPEDLLVFENLSRSRTESDLTSGRHRNASKTIITTGLKNASGTGSSNSSKRPRTILTTLQRKLFKAAFELSPKPCRKTRENLAKETGLNIRVVQVWFQNQRAKIKKIEKKSKTDMRLGGTTTKRFSNRYGAIAAAAATMSIKVPGGGSHSSNSNTVPSAHAAISTSTGLDDENTSDDFLSDSYSLMNDMIDVYSRGPVASNTTTTTTTTATSSSSTTTSSFTPINTLIGNNSTAFNNDIPLGFCSPIDNLFSMHNFYFDDSVVTSSSSIAGDFF